MTMPGLPKVPAVPAADVIGVGSDGEHLGKILGLL